jgi:radical SAM superfamily enzyme YgiQ (UPF0313 family)
MISTNQELAPQPVLPVGAAWVAQALHQAGFEVKFLDLCFEKDPANLIQKAIQTFRPDGIGISIRNLDNCDFLYPKSYLAEIRHLTDFLKFRTSAPILLGGSGVSIMPLQVLEFLDLDYAVVGEGEVAAVQFFQSVKAGEGRIPGLVCRGTTMVDTVPLRTNPNPVMPQLHRWVDTSSYLGFEPVIPIQGKRGCANRCLYCTYHTIEGKEWRPREPAQVVDEIAIAMTITGAKEFEFVDSVFNQPEGYLETLLEQIIRSRVQVRLHVSSLSPKGLTKEQVQLMERAGIISVVITPEAAADETLTALCKDFSAADVERASQLLGRSSIKALWCFLLGGPQEDEKTLAKTIRFINQRITSKDSAFLTTGIRIYPATGLHELAIKEGFVAPMENLLMPAFYFSPRLTLPQARSILQHGLDHPERCIFLSDTRLGSIGFFRRLSVMLGLPTPFWQYSGYMNRLMAGRRIISRTWLRSGARKKK